jgi:hypothetical protein
LFNDDPEKANILYGKKLVQMDQLATNENVKV